MARTRLLRPLALLMAVIGLGVLLRFTVLKPERVPVTVHRVGRGLVEETVTNSRSGTVRSRREADLSPEMGGRVVDLPAREGSRVRRGDVLLRLSDADLLAGLDLQQKALGAAEAGRREACRAAEQARRDLVRTRSLSRDRIVSVDLVEQQQSREEMAQASCEAAAARVEQARAAVSAAGAQLARTVLRAPFDGVVAEVSAEVGEWITPSPPGLPIPAVIKLLDPAAVYVSAPMDEVDVGRVSEGLPARVSLDAFPGRSFPAHVTRKAPYVLDVREQNRTFELEVTLDPGPLSARDAPALVPGSSADVEVILSARSGVLRVPSYAVQEGGHVLRVSGGVLESVPVKIGLKSWSFAELTSGLAEGDLVVVSLDRPEVKAGARAQVTGESEK